MSDVVPISEAKSQLSRLVKRAHDGEVIYIGAYGRAEAMLVPMPKRRSIPIGIWRDRRPAGVSYDTSELIEADPDITADFHEAMDRDETAR
ncbi:MAG: type II toxin-antitoxin system prevent-host-death family antitoxin [Microbacterium sp.]|nr:MAG: type II toxin-antitoxin system prevent-host-death family antitoxin [Microbacterium sp.]